MEPRSHSGRDGDEETIWAHREDLMDLARRLCRDTDQAEDVAHSTLVRAVAAGGIGSPGDVRRWLHRITALECLTARRARRQGSLEGLAEEPVFDGEAREAEEELRRRVLRAVAELPERPRTALLLRDGAGMPLEELAEILDTTPDGAKAMVYRARDTVRKRLPREL